MFKKVKLTEEDLRMRWILQTRAVIFFACMTLMRLYQLIRKDSYWFKGQELCTQENFKDCIGHYNSAIITEDVAEFFR